MQCCTLCRPARYAVGVPSRVCSLKNGTRTFARERLRSFDPPEGAPARALSGSERRCGRVPRMSKCGDRSSQGAGPCKHARRAARKAWGVGEVWQASWRAEPSTRAAHGVRWGDGQRPTGLRVASQGDEGRKSF